MERGDDTNWVQLRRKPVTLTLAFGELESALSALQVVRPTETLDTQKKIDAALRSAHAAHNANRN